MYPLWDRICWSAPKRESAVPLGSYARTDRSRGAPLVHWPGGEAVDEFRLAATGFRASLVAAGP